jgi:hypothetical protein
MLKMTYVPNTIGIPTHEVNLWHGIPTHEVNLWRYGLRIGEENLQITNEAAAR